jgi:hypothetical protein
MTLRFKPAVLLAFILGCSSESPAFAPVTDAAATPDTSVAKDTAVVDTGGTACATGEVNCDDKCVDVTSDRANCGACDKACGTGQNCVGGACQCAAPRVSCGAECIDTQTDAANCGTCGKTCATGEVCAEGKCYPPCPTGATRCGGICVNTQTDAKHCGMCAKACAAGQGCADGVCGVLCEFPTKNCGGTCINVNFDANNCGACGKICPTGPKGTANCTSGSCVLTCSTGFGNCDDDASNGCEIDLAATDKNCGVCGKTCTSFETCLSSKCECKTGTTRCSGVCVDITSSDANCGLCGRACTTNETCVSSTCTCKSGMTKCGLNCVDTTTDAANCGTCGTACGGGFGCSAGKCCPSGQINCGGVCVDPTKDSGNCGTCGTTCSGSTPYCVASSCAAMCGSGTVACGGSCTNTATDSKNCGACGTLCTTGQVCVGSACITGGFPGSGIITAAEGTKINTWVGTPTQLWTLCYSKATSASSATTFHSLCNNKGASVTIAKLSTGKIIGGYAPVAWTSSSSYKGDSTAFLFSVTNDFKHIVKTGMTSYFMYDGSTYGPTFGGGHDMYIDSTLNSGYCNIGFTYNCRIGVYPDATCRNDFCGTYNGWSVTALEVWVK